MKRKPLTRGEWALLIFPLLILIFFSFAPFSMLRDAWLQRKYKAGPGWSTLTWSPDSRFIALGGGVVIHEPQAQGQTFVPGQKPKPPILSHGDVELYDADATLLKRLVGHNSPVTQTEFSPDGKTLLSATSGGIRLWDVSSGTEMKNIDLRYPSPRWKDNKTIESSSLQRIARGPGLVPRTTQIYVAINSVSGAVTPIDEPVYFKKPPGIRSKTGRVAVQRLTKSQSYLTKGWPSSRLIHTGGEVEIFDAKGRIVQTLSEQTDATMAWREDDVLVRLCPVKAGYEAVGLMLLTTNLSRGTQKARMLNLQPFEKPTPVPTPAGQSAYWREPDREIPKHGTLSGDGRYAAVWSSKSMWLVDCASGTAVASWLGTRAQNVNFSPDSRSLAWTEERTLRVVDVATGRAKNF